VTSWCGDRFESLWSAVQRCCVRHYLGVCVGLDGLVPEVVGGLFPLCSFSDQLIDAGWLLLCQSRGL